jgi:muramoyltetrapeptide carboxypeptidase
MLEALKPGDTIGIAATARKISYEELLPSIAIFESWGLHVKIASNIGLEYNQFAGNDESFLVDPDIKAIICARGGYGTVRIIDLLDFEAFSLHPKWLIGYSDITVLHSKLNLLRIPSVHGTMPINMQPDKADEESIALLKQILFSDTVPKIETPPHSLNRIGGVKAELVGGNLSVLYSQLASVSDLDTNGKILFLEDLDEYLYHIDRMMMTMKRAGKLDNLAGLIIGGMSDMKDNAIPFGKTAEEIISEHISAYDYPVCFGFPSGHEKRNLPLVFGKIYHFSVTEKSASLDL